MLKHLHRCLICIVSLTTSLSAVAATRIQMVASSDYVVQGISQTRGESSLQGGVSYAHKSGLFAGLWLAENALIPSLYGDNDRTLREVDYYVGYEWLDQQERPWTLMAVHYSYPGSDGPFSDYRYNELSLSATPVAGLSATIGINDNLYNRNRYSRFYELAYEKAIGQQTLFNAGIGYNNIDALYYRGGDYYSNYGYWNIGITQLAGRLMFDLSYVGTQDVAVEQFGSRVAGSRWVFSITGSF
jgi:uncharacterized protein (TIGR02001 family)